MTAAESAPRSSASLRWPQPLQKDRISASRFRSSLQPRWRRLTRTRRRRRAARSRNLIKCAKKAARTVRSDPPLATSKDTWGAVSRGIGQCFS